MKKYTIILAILFVSLIASAILSFIPLEKACGGIQTTCYAVQTSDYETTLGIKNSHLGLLAFSVLATFTIFQIKNPKKSTKRIITIGVIISSIVAVYFLYIQFFVIDAICKYCIIIDAGAIINLGVLFLWKEK